MGALNLVSRAAAGSMRDALSLMDQAIAYSSGKVDEPLVRTMLGAIDQGFLFDILQALKAGNGAELLRIADDMAARSVAFEAALQDLATLLHRIALVQTIPGAIPDDEPERARLMELAQQFTPEEIQLDYQIAIHGRNEIDLAPDEYAGFTMTLLRMLAFAPQAVGANATPVAPRSMPAKAASAAAQSVAAAPAATYAAAPVAPVAATSAPEGALPANMDWNTLLAQLNLSGMARELAKNSVLAEFANNRLVLSLPPQHKQFLTNKVAQEKLQTALTKYFARPVRLEVVLGSSSEVATPAAVERQDKQNRQQQAEDAIRQDAFVREAQAILGAQLIEGSIRPV